MKNWLIIFLTGCAFIGTVSVAQLAQTEYQTYHLLKTMTEQY